MPPPWSYLAVQAEESSLIIEKSVSASKICRTKAITPRMGGSNKNNQIKHSILLALTIAVSIIYI